MKKIILLVLMLAVKASFAQLNNKFFKYGFIDKEGKEIVVPKYEKADDFVDGAAIVRISTGK